MNDLHFHCMLREGKTHLIGWIEERGAKVGVKVGLKGKEGLWDVVEVHSPGAPSHGSRTTRSPCDEACHQSAEAQIGWLPEWEWCALLTR